MRDFLRKNILFCLKVRLKKTYLKALKPPGKASKWDFKISENDGKDDSKKRFENGLKMLTQKIEQIVEVPVQP